MKQKRRKSYTILFVPDDNQKTFSIRIGHYFFYCLFFSILVLLSGIVILLFNVGRIGLKLQMTYQLLYENNVLTKESEQLRGVASTIRSMELTSSYLRRLARSVGENQVEATIIKLTGHAQNDMSADMASNPDSMVDSLTYTNHPTSEPTREPYSFQPPTNEVFRSVPNIAPVDGWITQHFKRNSSGEDSHFGIDFAAKHGTPIRSTAPGIVESIENTTDLGILITVRHKLGFVTRYGHCSQALLSIGDRVQRGQTIGLVGNTGKSTAPHVHYEILKDNRPVDPILYIMSQLK